MNIMSELKFRILNSALRNNVIKIDSDIVNRYNYEKKEGYYGQKS